MLVLMLPAGVNNLQLSVLLTVNANGGRSLALQAFMIKHMNAMMEATRSGMKPNADLAAHLKAHSSLKSSAIQLKSTT